MFMLGGFMVQGEMWRVLLFGIELQFVLGLELRVFGIRTLNPEP